MSATLRDSLLGSVVLGFLCGSALGAPGDIHRVSGADVVNLRAGPTDSSNIRGKVDQGDEVIELTREGNWIGVRVLQTGEEGWVYGGLLERVTQSGLLPRDAAAGNRQCSVVPRSGLFSAHSRPPCAATMVREIESPKPSPCSFVVTNGSNSRSISLAGIPVPPSRIATCT